jgi:hypothetical protein
MSVILAFWPRFRSQKSERLFIKTISKKTFLGSFTKTHTKALFLIKRLKTLVTFKLRLQSEFKQHEKGLKNKTIATQDAIS